MKKRFTDADIWKKAWFRKLSPRMKAFFHYLKDNCDQVGVWEADYEMASMCIGDEVTENDLEVFGDRLIKTSADKVLLVDFVAFQNGVLTHDCRPHRPIISLLGKHGLAQNQESGEVYPIGYQRVSDTLEVKVKVKVKEQVKVKVKEEKRTEAGQQFEILDELKDLPEEVLREASRIPQQDQELLIFDYGPETVREKLVAFADHNLSLPANKKKKSPNLTIRNWLTRDGVESRTSIEKRQSEANAKMARLEAEAMKAAGASNV